MNFGAAMASVQRGQLPTFQEEPACASLCPNISYKERLIGFAVCFVVGWFLSLAGTLSLLAGPSAKNIRTFAILYVLGNVVALCSTGFLVGPRSQCANMLHPSRKWTTFWYMVMLILVFVLAMTKQPVGAVLFCLLIQVLVGTWYAISYIPFARKAVLSFLRSTPVCQPFFEAADQVKEAVGTNKQKESKSGYSALV